MLESAERHQGIQRRDESRAAPFKGFSLYLLLSISLSLSFFFCNLFYFISFFHCSCCINLHTFIWNFECRFLCIFCPFFPPRLLCLLLVNASCWIQLIPLIHPVTGHECEGARQLDLGTRMTGHDRSHYRCIRSSALNLDPVHEQSQSIHGSIQVFTGETKNTTKQTRKKQKGLLGLNDVP